MSVRATPPRELVPAIRAAGYAGDTWADVGVPVEVRAPLTALAMHRDRIPSPGVWDRLSGVGDLPLAPPADAERARAAAYDMWRGADAAARARIREWAGRAVDLARRAVRSLGDIADRTADDAVRAAARHVATTLRGILEPTSRAIRHAITEPVGALGPGLALAALAAVMFLTTRRGSR